MSAPYPALHRRGSLDLELGVPRPRWDNPSMGDYCAFSKAVEQLGDRWSLVIIRELVAHGTRGYSDLLDGATGISRSVLAARLRKLRDLGLVERVRTPGDGHAPERYAITYAGQELRPVLEALRGWSQRFVPEDPAMVERDPDIVVRWLGDRVDPELLPSRPVVLDISLEGARRSRFWLVLERGIGASVCIEDPAIAEDRYLFLETSVGSLMPLARGAGDWRRAIEDDAVEVFGDPHLIAQLPTWFEGRPTRALQAAAT
jgi:DNA-binding HxlR family transcriptional regulator